MELVKLVDGKSCTSSRLIAQHFNKEHKDVLRAIKNLDCSADFNRRNFALVDYVDGKGEKRPEYVITRDGFTFLAVGFTGKEAAKFKEDFIGEFNKFESLLKPSDDEIIMRALTIQQSKIENLTEALNAEKEINRLQLPKAIFSDAVSVSKTTILIGELAKIIKQNGFDIGQNRLFSWLRDNEYLVTRKGTDFNMPTQKSMNLELFVIKETAITHSDGHISISKTVKVTGKGQIYFVNKFIRGDDFSLTA